MMERLNYNYKNLQSFLSISFFYTIIYALALILKEPFENTNLYVFTIFSFEINHFLVVLFVLAMFIVISNYLNKKIFRLAVLSTIDYIIFLIFLSLLYLNYQFFTSVVLSIIISSLITVLICFYSEWWVLDFSGILTATGIIILIGTSLNILSIIALMMIISLYDLVSVYKTKKMIDVADESLNLKLPVMIIIPKTKNFSLLKGKTGLKQDEEKNENEKAIFVGLGDIIIPGLLIMSIYVSIPNSLTIVLSTIVGTLIGLIIVISLVFKGKPQPAIPYLTAGSVTSFIIANFAVHGKIIGL